jgi:dihydroneopterin aldolase
MLAEAPHPNVVVLGNRIIGGDRLPALLDQMIGSNELLVLCVTRAAQRRARARTPEAQLRVELLELDQNAWILGSRDTRLMVVSTRTELDLALQRGMPCVVAPSRIELDRARDGPPQSDGLRFASWLASEISAVGFVEIGMRTGPYQLWAVKGPGWRAPET